MRGTCFYLQITNVKKFHTQLSPRDVQLQLMMIELELPFSVTTVNITRFVTHSTFPNQRTEYFQHYIQYMAFTQLRRTLCTNL